MGDTVTGSYDDGCADKHYINLSSIDKRESADAIDTDECYSDYSDAEERTDRMYSTSGTGTTDQDGNTPYYCGTPTRVRRGGGKPPLSPKAGQANSTVLKRLSRAASKYGISLNLNLNLNATRFQIHQAGNRLYEENIFKKTNDERSDSRTDSYGSSEQGSVAGDDYQWGKQRQHHTHGRSTQTVCDSELEILRRSTKDFALNSTSRKGGKAQTQPVHIDDRDDNNDNTYTDITRQNKITNESKDSSCCCSTQDGCSNNTRTPTPTLTLSNPDENLNPTNCTWIQVSQKNVILTK